MIDAIIEILKNFFPDEDFYNIWEYGNIEPETPINKKEKMIGEMTTEERELYTFSLICGMKLQSLAVERQQEDQFFRTKLEILSMAKWLSTETMWHKIRKRTGITGDIGVREGFKIIQAKREFNEEDLRLLLECGIARGVYF